MTAQARVAVIVLNHPAYTQADFPACYASLQAQSYPATQFTVFVVTNEATAVCERLIRRLAPEARTIENPRNLGWAGGNNAAIRVVLREAFEYVVLLNVDTVVDREWLAALVRAADARRDVHILQSTLILHGTGRINSMGNRLQFLGYGYCQGYGQPVSSARPPARIDYASGASMMVRREVFDRIGLFLDEYFLYYEDVEFCWRARLAGYAIGLAEDSICHHKYTFQSTVNWLYYVQRNRLFTLFTMENVPTLCLIAPCLLVAEAIVDLYFLLHGRGRAVGRVLWYFLQPASWRAIREHRRRVASLRRKRDAEIVRQFAGTIVFAEVNQPLLRYVFNPLLAAYWGIVRRLIVW